MAGRIRSIKPELIDDAVTAGLSHEAFRLFVAMIVLADDHGNLRASPNYLDGQVFHERRSLVPMAQLVIELGRKLVTFYAVDGQPYAHLNGWHKHQRIENAGEPRVPVPPGWQVERVEKSDGKRTRVRWASRPAAVATLAVTDVSGVATVAILDRVGQSKVATAGSGSGSGSGGGGEAGTEPPALPPPDELANYLFSDLVDEASQFPTLPKADLAWTAYRMAKRIERDSGGRAHGGPYLTDALGWLPTWTAEHDDASDKRKLAEVERKFGFRAGDDAAADYARGQSALASLRAMDGAA